MSETTSSTIGFERTSNAMLALGDESSFVNELVSGLAPQPPNFRLIVEANRLGQSPPDGHLALLDPAQLAERADAGALVIDGRSAAEYDAAHIPGSVGVERAHSGFGTKVAWIADRDGDLVVIGADDAEAREMDELLASVGLSASGMLAGGFAAWVDSGRPVEAFEAVDAEALPGLLGRRPEVQVLDVRDDEEWEEGHIPGSLHLPYHDVGRADPPFDLDRPVAVICSTGRRSATAAGLVRRLGAREVIHVTQGGVGTWAKLGHPIEQPATARA
jgi:rhodanese-related sulfurtransferase